MRERKQGRRAARNYSSAAVYLRLLGYVKPYWHWFLLSFLGFAVYSSSQPMLAKLMEFFVDGLQGRRYDLSAWLPPEASITGLVQSLPWLGQRLADTGAVEVAYLVPVLVVVIYVYRSIGAFVGNYLMAKVSFWLIHDLRSDLFNRLLYLPNSYFDQNSSGHILSKVTYNVNQVTQAATRATKVLLREGTTVVALLSYLFWENWRLTLIFLFISPFIAYLVAISGKQIKKYSKQAQQTIGDATHVTKETITGFHIVRSFGGEDYEKRRFQQSSVANRKQNLRVVRISELYTAFMQLTVASAMAVMMYLALTMMGDHSAGALIAYVSAAAMLPKPLRQLSELNSMIQKGVAAAESVFDIIDAQTEQDTGDYECDRVKGRLDIRKLSFRYPGTEEDVLHDINLVVQPGEMVALVGASGSGKTTLANLIPRFYNHQQGQILLDDVEIETYRLANLRSHIALVGQQVVLFSGTLADNIAYGKLQGTPREAIEQVAEAAYLTGFVKDLPEGLDTYIGEDGGRLSGGQRQRLAIARALLKNAPILILDEATSALDTESERYIQAALEKVMQGRTTLVIAHRLSTIEKADKIVVMDKGRIIEVGTHSELMERQGAYRYLHDMQFSQQDSPVPTTED